MRAYTDRDGVVRLAVYQNGERLGTFGLAADVGEPFKPDSWVELDDERVAAVAIGLRLFGDGPHEYRQSFNPHMQRAANDDAQPDQPSRRKARVVQPDDTGIVSPGDQSATGGG